MVELMQAGGWSMWMVLFLSLATILAAIRFVAGAQVGRLTLVRALTCATVFAILTGLCANLAAVMTRLASEESLAPQAQLARLLAGLAEAVAPGILGFAMLCVSWLLVAVGTRRAHDRAGG